MTRHFPIGFQCFLLVGLAVVGCNFVGDGTVESICAPQVDITNFRCTQARITEVPLMIHPETLEVDLSHNLIEILHEDSFSRLRAVRKLLLGNNQIYKLTDLAFVPIANTLRVLDLRNNQLISSEATLFPVPAFAPLSNLVDLDLSGNHLAVLPSTFLRSAGHQLKRLRISSCTVKMHIEDKAFEGLNQLTHLDLSYNTFAEVDEQAFEGLRAEQFQIFLLHGSRWICDCRILWLHQWLNRMSRVGQLQISDHASGECYSPSEVRGQHLMKVSIASLRCAPQLLQTSPPGKDSNLIPVVGLHGFNLTLACTFISEPRPRIDWYKNGILVKQDQAKIGLDTGLGTKFTTILYIYDLEHDLDSGVYQCESANHIGRAWAMFYLRIDKSAGLRMDGLRSHDNPTGYQDFSGYVDVSHRATKYVLITSAIITIHFVLIVVCVITYKCLRRRSRKVKEPEPPAGQPNDKYEWKEQQQDIGIMPPAQLLQPENSPKDGEQVNWTSRCDEISPDPGFSASAIGNFTNVTPQIKGYHSHFSSGSQTNRINSLFYQSVPLTSTATQQTSGAYYTLITRTNRGSQLHELAYSPNPAHYAKQTVSPSTSEEDDMDLRQASLLNDCSFHERRSPEGEPTPIKRPTYSPVQWNPHAVLETDRGLHGDEARKCALHPNVNTSVCPIHGSSSFSSRGKESRARDLQQTSLMGYSNPKLNTFNVDYPNETFARTKHTCFRGYTLPR